MPLTSTSKSSIGDEALTAVLLYYKPQFTILLALNPVVGTETNKGALTAKGSKPRE
jgi:hypothetical protein